MPLRRVAIVLIAVGLLASAGAVVALGWTPTVPADAGSVALVHATLTGDVLPDPGAEADLEQVPRTPAGQQCLDRITHQSGWLDLCWDAYRTPDRDPHKDYYLLRVHGTLRGAGTGVRWWTVRATLAGQLGQPADGVFEGWPDGTIEGPCRSVQAPSFDVPEQDWICGRTTGAPVATAWGHAVTWVCVGCVMADHSAREVVLREQVAVAEGTVPEWDIGADFGD